MLITALSLAAAFGLGLTAWLARTASLNPDIQTKRPGWLEATAGFQVSFWVPLALTVGVGALLVCFVYARALQRLAKGEDLYANRYGRGLRRRGEDHIESEA
ncbi:hypothetical protein BH23BAC4_BH23BAC4_13600 [soil metagenome]